ncbi:MAG: hypothetical protein JXD23_10590 [Spirochaetales bacterium]|nr:hypothetical protein [Spirochaetales bacterium]
MPRSFRNLFLGLAKRSTGEATYIVRQISALAGGTGIDAGLRVNENLADVVSGYRGDTGFLSFARLSFLEILSEIEAIAADWDGITFIDLNCFFLEANIRPAQRENFFSLVRRLAANGKTVSCVDYFSTFTESVEEWKERVERCRERNLRRLGGMPADDRLGYYLRKFMPERMEAQIMPPLEGVSVLRPVPLNRPGPRGPYFFHYDNRLSSAPAPRADGKRRSVLLALSRFFEYTVPREVIRSLCRGIVRNLHRHLDVERIVLIDPFACTSDLDGTTPALIETRTWLNKETLHAEIDEALFVGLFVPYGTLGTISLSRGVPFVSFRAGESGSSSESYRELAGGAVYPGFNALGVWEDEAFFSDLAEGNPYFDAVETVDIARADAFSELAGRISSRAMERRVKTYRDFCQRQAVPSFGEALLNVVGRETKADHGT